MVDSMTQLDQYPWTGHGALMGHTAHEFQDTDYVLEFFGGNEKQARKGYRQFVEKGIPLGRQPDLVGGGLIRSAGGWSEVKALRRIGQMEKTDTRILGTGAFVEQILSETDTIKKYRLTNSDREADAVDLIRQNCQAADIHVPALTGGSRQHHVCKVRHALARRLTAQLGLSFAETARLLGVTTSAVAKIHMRRNDEK
jgi:hypothetical protein